MKMFQLINQAEIIKTLWLEEQQQKLLEANISALVPLMSSDSWSQKASAAPLHVKF